MWLTEECSNKSVRWMPESEKAVAPTSILSTVAMGVVSTIKTKARQGTGFAIGKGWRHTIKFHSYRMRKILAGSKHRTAV